MMKKVIKLLGEIMNESFKCHLYIPQPRKGMYVMNIIGQCILEERICEGKKSQENTKMLIPPIGIHKPNGGKNYDNNLEGKGKSHMQG
jgi:hypothetical protein